MQDVLAGLVDELRAVGIGVSVGEHLDAARALSAISPWERDVVRAALQCALVKRADQLETFNLLFELYTAGVGEQAAEQGAPPGLRALTDQQLRDALRAAIGSRDARVLRLLADEYVRRFGGLEPGSPVAGVFAAMAVDAAAGLDGIRAELLAGQGEPGAGGAGGAGKGGAGADGAGADGDNSKSGGGEGGGGGAGGDNSNRIGGGGWGARAIRARLDEVAADQAVEAFRADLRTAIRRALVADRGARAVRATMRVGLAQDADIAGASATELAAMVAAIGPLAGRLSYVLAQLATRRKRTLSIRRTLHLAMGTGGIPFRLATEPPRPPKPEIVVLCDMSGSVSAFSRFTLDLLIALDSRLSRLRVFAFVDDVAEITSLVREARAAGRRLHPREASAGAVRLGGSDYGFVLRAFASRHAHQLSKRSVVLVVGDARTNYLDPAQAAFAEIADRAGQVYWLNPEPRRLWNEGDSVIGRYAPWCASVRECRTLRQIADFVQSLAASPASTRSGTSATLSDVR